MTMYTRGTKVVHPCYGAGIIDLIQEKSIAEKSHRYYVINTMSKSLQVMVAVDRAESVGLRRVGEPSGLRKTLVACSVTPSEDEIEKDHRGRQSDMRERLKSGCYEEVADVVRLLFFMHSRRPLGIVDRQLLDQGKDLLAGELAVAAGSELQDAVQEIEDQLVKMLEDKDEQA